MHTDKLLLIINGGLGDLLVEYFRSREWGVIKQLKEENPSLKVKAVICSHNSNTKDFLEYCPLVDKVETHHGFNFHLSDAKNIVQYICPQQKDWTFIGDAFYMWKHITPVAPKVYLNAADKDLVERTKKSGPYIALHPFAGTPDRICFSQENYRILISRIIEETGHNVVILGGKHQRTIGEAEGEVTQRSTIHEAFDSFRPNAISLVNKASCRASVQIAKNAAAYVGNYAGLIMAPWTEEIPTLVHIAESHRKMSEISNTLSWPTTRGWAFNKAIFPETKTIEETFDETISFLKERTL